MMPVTDADREAAVVLATEICGCANPAQRNRDVNALLEYRKAAYQAGMIAGAKAMQEKTAKTAQNYGGALIPADGWPEAEKTGFETGVLDCAAAIASAIRAIDPIQIAKDIE